MSPILWCFTTVVDPFAIFFTYPFRLGLDKENLSYNCSPFNTQLLGPCVQKLLSLFLFPLFLYAAELHLPVKTVNDDASSATVEIKQIAEGVHGFIVRHFNSDHSVIVADAYVSAFDADSGVATLALSPYEGLKQNSLPNGNWHVQVGDEAILAFGYSRALLLAPSEDIYHIVTKNIHGVEWIHPDNFATYLSYRSHPTPFREDIAGYCTMAEIGLLYTYVDGALFTLDCQTLRLIQLTPVALEYKESSLPFYSRVAEIATSWWVWGEASRTMEAYDPHYLELLVDHNSGSKPLYDYIDKLETPEHDLIKNFTIKE